MNLKTFFAVATPTTLASLVFDMEQIDDQTNEMVDLSSAAYQELCAIVGDEEANSMIVEAGRGQAMAGNTNRIA